MSCSEPQTVTAVPEGLTLERNRDLRGRERNPWTRRALLTLLSLPRPRPGERLRPAARHCRRLDGSCVLTVGVSYAGWKFPFLRPALEGQPIIVVQDGEPIQRNLDRNRITVDEVRTAMRHEGIATLAEVEWAMLETGGRMTFIKG